MNQLLVGFRHEGSDHGPIGADVDHWYVAADPGVLIAILVVCGYAAMILNSILNVYYASLYFVVGALYTYRIFKKSQVALNTDNIGSSNKPRRGDRFLKGGKEEQAEFFETSSTGGSAAQFEFNDGPDDFEYEERNAK